MSEKIEFRKDPVADALAPLIPAGETVQVRFRFDLAHSSNRRADGAGAITDRGIYAWDGKELVSVPLDETGYVNLDIGSGCVSLFSEKDGVRRTICRSTAGKTGTLKKVITEIADIKDGKTHEAVTLDDSVSFCPKCGRPYAPGSKKCNRCSRERSSIIRLLVIAKPWRFMIILSVVLYFVSSAVSLVVPYLNRILVDDYINKAQNTPVSDILTGFITILVAMFVINVIQKLINVVRSLALIEAGNGLKLRLRQLLFDKIISLSVPNIQTRTSGELINRVSSDTDVLSNFITNDLGEVAQMIITLVAVITVLLVYDWRIALLIVLPVPFIMVINRAFRRFLHKYFRLSWTVSSGVTTFQHDTFSGIRVVKSFRTEKKETDKFRDLTEKERKVAIKAETTAGILMPVIGFLLGFGEFFLMYYVGNRILNGTMTIGEMAQFSSYAGIIYGPIRWLSHLPRMISRTATSVSKIFEIMDDENLVTDRENAENIPIDGKIEFDHLSFYYDITKPVLRDLSFTINKGEMIGIVGRSGVGKSTLINLVMRLYDPVEGSVKIDGRDLRDFSQQSLRSQMGVVLQENYLFRGTVFDNILYAKKDATRKDVISAAKLSGAHKFIINLPDGYETVIGENGYTLSGGERQRVSIARAILRDPRILILDEATSALDTETEKDVQEVLYRLTRDKTTLVIAHRLSTLRNADRILVLDKGRLAEFGSHEELMKKKGIYYDLVMIQRDMSKKS